MTGHQIVIVRHGATFAPGEAPRRIGARTDLPLSEAGHRQAHALGARFAGEGWCFGRILCSPLRRTRETAEAIRAAMPGAPTALPCDLLAEIDHGPDEGRPEDAVVARIGPAALAAWDREGTVPDGWHADRDRRIAGWRALFAQAGADNALLVTSNGAARFALLADAGLTPQAAALPSLKLRTGAFGILRMTVAGPRLDAWNALP
jgi:probable phosphoglycerate mutase